MPEIVSRESCVSWHKIGRVACPFEWSQHSNSKHDIGRRIDKMHVIEVGAQLHCLT